MTTLRNSLSPRTQNFKLGTFPILRSHVTKNDKYSSLYIQVIYCFLFSTFSKLMDGLRTKEQNSFVVQMLLQIIQRKVKLFICSLETTCVEGKVVVWREPAWRLVLSVALPLAFVAVLSAPTAPDSVNG